MTALPFDGLWVVAGFAAFRVFDITRPWPMYRRPGGSRRWVKSPESSVESPFATCFSRRSDSTHDAREQIDASDHRPPRWGSGPATITAPYTNTPVELVVFRARGVAFGVRLRPGAGWRIRSELVRISPPLVLLMVP